MRQSEAQKVLDEFSKREWLTYIVRMQETVSI